MFVNWCFSSNKSYHKGGRIIISWKPSCFHVNIIAASSQFMHCYVAPVSGMNSFYCTFIYDFNDRTERKELWKDLKSLYTQDPWIMCGDFNCVMVVAEFIGAMVRQTEMEDIITCMQEC